MAALLDAIGLQATGMGLVRQAVEKLGGFEDLYADIELVAAHHGDNFEMLVARHMKTDRSTMFELTERLELVATSEDRKILDALAHAERHREMTRDYIPAYDEAGRPLDTSFATGNWHKALGDRGQSGQLHRRHFEACVFTYLAEELRTGDVAVAGADEYADWSEQLLPWEECEALLPQYLIDVGLRTPSADGAAGPGPYTAVSFREQLEDLLTKTAAIADAGYPANDDLVIDGDGTPHLKRHRREDRRASSLKLEAQIKARLPERSLLGILARTAYWIEWWRRFGPASGSDPKIKDPFGRYVLATFVYGINMSAADAARHIAGTSARDLALVANRHVTVDKLNEAITDVVNAYARLDLIKAWGDGIVGRGRRHPHGHLPGQPPRGDLDPLWGIRRDRLPPHLRPLHRPVHALRAVRGVGGRLHHRGAAEERLGDPADHDPRRYPGPESACLHDGAPDGVRPDAPHPPVAGPDLLAAVPDCPVRAHRRPVRHSPAATSSTGT